MQQYFQHASYATIVGLAMIATPVLSVSAQPVVDQRFERLPSVVEPSSPSTPFSKQHKSIQFAGGAVALQAPQGWWTQEVPFGREVRLLLAPERPANLREMPRDAIWIAYHPAEATQQRSEAELAEQLTMRLRTVTGEQGQYSQVSHFRFGAWPAVVIEFTLSSAVSGRHVLVRTDWGLFEFHTSAPESLVDSRSVDWTATWNTLRLSPPPTRNDAAATGTSRIIATWKSYRSQMSFSSDGRVVIVPDSAGTNQVSSPLIGAFEARDDLVFIRWSDGSRLNLRWRLSGNELFLTDHEGKITHLKRVFD
jgi:hypothetical protein